MWCTHSFKKGFSQWLQIKNKIPKPYVDLIAIEISHVMCGHGIEQARLALKDEIEKFIIFLIGENLYEH